MTISYLVGVRDALILAGRTFLLMCVVTFASYLYPRMKALLFPPACQETPASKENNIYIYTWIGGGGGGLCRYPVHMVLSCWFFYDTDCVYSKTFCLLSSRYATLSIHLCHASFVQFQYVESYAMSINTVSTVN